MYDLIIVGSGPAGLAAAIYAKRSNLDVAVIEKEYEGSGQIAESQRVDNYPGVYGISGYDLGEKLRQHALSLEVRFIEEEVLAIEKEDQVFQLKVSGKESYSAKSIIFAAGASPRKGDVEGEVTFAGKGISYCALCDGAFYKNKKVAVLGGGDTALDDALYLADICEEVFLVHRREEFRGAKATVSKLREKKNVTFVLGEQVLSIWGVKKVEGLCLKSGRMIEVDGVFIAFGSIPNSDLVKGLAELDEHGYVIASEDGITNCPGLFVAGDVRTKELRQVVTAVSDGANAATSSYKYIKQ